MTKYATLRKYQPYIDVIMNDLGLTGKVFIEWRFAKYSLMGGDARLFNNEIGKIRVDSECDHKETLRIIMHELRHIQQMHTDRLSSRNVSVQKKTRRGVKYVSGRLWDGVAYEQHKLKRGKATSDYKLQPWEQDAHAYEKEITRLFPSYKLPVQESRKLIGIVGKIKFYKTAS